MALTIAEALAERLEVSMREAREAERLIEESDRLALVLTEEVFSELDRILR